MLQIHPKQMEAFGGVTDDLLAKRIVGHLRADYSDTMVQLPSGSLTVKEIEEAELKAMVTRGVAQARAYGIDHESALATFVAIMFEAAPNFDAHPELNQTLRDESVAPNSRIDKLLERFNEKIWEEVRASYDQQAWIARS
jgi:adenine-specific DNA methylase